MPGVLRLVVPFILFFALHGVVLLLLRLRVSRWRSAIIASFSLSAVFFILSIIFVLDYSLIIGIIISALLFIRAALFWFT